MGRYAALLLVPGDGYEGDYLQLFVLNQVLLYTLLYMYYTSQFKRMREKETSDEKTEVKDQEHSG